MSFISVCAEHHQQLVALRYEQGGALVAAPAAQHGVVLTVPVVDRDGVVVALARQAVTCLQVQEGKEELDPVAGGLSDAPVAVDVVWVDVWKMGAAKGAAYCCQHLLAFTCKAFVKLGCFRNTEDSFMADICILILFDHHSSRIFIFFYTWMIIVDPYPLSNMIENG